ncbi:MAG TPA: hypothetical protein VH137_04550, partial [Gemmatimonadales bacterium]|nr:hypothetical protein [Gemmatimonadales bacterium]
AAAPRLLAAAARSLPGAARLSAAAPRLSPAAPRARAGTIAAPETCPEAPPGAAAALGGVTHALASAAALAQPPLPAPPPAQILVCVGSLPITGAVFGHWSNVARKSEVPPPKHPASAGQIADEVLSFLISSDWILEEARALHIHLAAATVRRSFERIRFQQFPRHGEFGMFLRASGQTPADLLFRVRLNLLSTRVQAHVLRGRRSAQARERAVVRFIHDFKRRWQARTYCTTGYAVADCGHVVSPPL